MPAGDHSPQTGPDEILEFRFSDAARDPSRAAARESFWFGASDETDAEVRRRFGGAIEAAARGELGSWVEQPRSSLALVIMLDQFPRNVWRDTARAFAHDPLALAVARGAVAAGHLGLLSPIEQAFLVLPYEHSESLDAQRACVRLSLQIAREAPAQWKPVLEIYTDYARQHLALIERFGRFPHRNQVLGRESTPEERAYLGAGGQTFGPAVR